LDGDGKPDLGGGLKFRLRQRFVYRKPAAVEVLPQVLCYQSRFTNKAMPNFIAIGDLDGRWQTDLAVAKLAQDKRFGIAHKQYRTAAEVLMQVPLLLRVDFAQFLNHVQ